MALVFMEGAETFGDADEYTFDPRVRENAGSADIVSDTRYTGGQSFYRYSNTSILRFDYDQNIAGGATWYCGVAIKISQFRTTDYPCIRWTQGGDGTIKNSLYMQATTGDLLFCRGTTTIHEVSGADGFVANEWAYWVFKVKDDPTTGTLEIWKDGVKVADETGLNTGDGTTAYTGIAFLAQSITYHYYDDCYVGDDSGSDMTDQVGEVRMESVPANANGTTNDFTASPAVANYLNVDDGATHDGDTTYNYSSTATDKELYGTSNLTGDVGDVHAVQPHIKTRLDFSLASKQGNIVCRSSATEADGPTVSPFGAYQNFTKIYENDPNGAVNWTEGTANSAEIGFEISA